MKSLGICTGSSNISMVLLEKKEDKILKLESRIVPHDGNPQDVVELIIKEMA